jgi:hypothetical protein
MFHPEWLSQLGHVQQELDYGLLFWGRKVSLMFCFSMGRRRGWRYEFGTPTGLCCARTKLAGSIGVIRLDDRMNVVF